MKRTKTLTASDLERVDAFREEIQSARRKLDDLVELAREREWPDRVAQLRTQEAKLMTIDREIAGLFR